VVVVLRVGWFCGLGVVGLFVVIDVVVLFWVDL